MKKLLILLAVLLHGLASFVRAMELPVIPSEDFSKYLTDAVLPMAIAVEGVITLEEPGVAYIGYDDVKTGKAKRLIVSGVASLMVWDAVKRRLNNKQVKVGGVLVERERSIPNFRDVSLTFAKVLEINEEKLHSWDELSGYTEDRWVKIKGILQYDKTEKGYFLIPGTEGLEGFKLAVPTEDKYFYQNLMPPNGLGAFYGKFVPNKTQAKESVIGSLLDISNAHHEEMINLALIDLLERVPPNLISSISGLEFSYADVWLSKPQFAPTQDLRNSLKETNADTSPTKAVGQGNERNKE